MVVEPVDQQDFKQGRIQVPDKLNSGKSAADDDDFFQGGGGFRLRNVLRRPG